MEIFIRDDGDKYLVFFGPNSAGWFPKEKVHCAQDLEYIIRNISYKYCTEWSGVGKTKTTSYQYSNSRNKDQGILKDFVDLFW